VVAAHPAVPSIDVGAYQRAQGLLQAAAGDLEKAGEMLKEVVSSQVSVQLARGAI